MLPFNNKFNIKYQEFWTQMQPRFQNQNDKCSRLKIFVRYSNTNYTKSVFNETICRSIFSLLSRSNLAINILKKVLQMSYQPEERHDDKVYRKKGPRLKPNKGAYLLFAFSGLFSRFNCRRFCWTRCFN